MNQQLLKHCKNCECCPCHSLFKGHKVIVNNVVVTCQQCNQCFKCQVSGHKIAKNLKIFQKSLNCYKKVGQKLRPEIEVPLTSLKNSKSFRVVPHRFFNHWIQKVKVTDWRTESVIQSVTRSPIELFWTAKNAKVSWIWKFVKHLSMSQRSDL